MSKNLVVTFWSLVGISFVILAEFFIPALRDLFRGSELFLFPLIIFSLLGVLLFILTLRNETKGRLRKFLLLTGASAAGFFIFVFLHNMFYALNVITGHVPIVSYLTEALHVISFIIAIIICPIGFLVGILGSVILFIKKSKF